MPYQLYYLLPFCCAEEHERKLAEAAAHDLSAAMTARVEELHRQLASLQERLHQSDSSKTKYKDIVRALKVRAGPNSF